MSMKVLLHRLDGGASFVTEAPVPAARGSRVLIETRASVVSAGTERMLVEFGRANLLSKVRQQPDKVKQVLDKARTDGIVATFEAVQSKLSEPIALGYCQAGVVVERGSPSVPFELGTRVVSNGAHAEYVSVPHTLVARIPEGVPFDVAAFTPLAAIGLQGIRLAAPTLGETVVVYGLGLIGLLTVQLLRANGCRVVDVSRQKCGWDITSYPPDVDGKQPDARHIEVKGRIQGAGTITITRNEMVYALNQSDKFLLAIVLVGENDTVDGPHYLRNPFESEPSWGVSSINFDIKALLDRAEKT